MKSKLFLSVLIICAAALVASCSGLKSGTCKINCGGGGGNANLSLTISDIPPANTSILSFTMPVIGITLTSSTGQTSVSSTSQNFELTRLQSDTNLIAAKLPVAAGTYTAINVTVASPSGFFLNSTGSAIGTCLAGAICALTGSPSTITYTFPVASPLVLTANANQWLDLDFNYNNAIVTSNGALKIDVTQAGVLTASSTIPTGVPNGNVANIDDFTGSVTALSSNSITLVSSVRGTLIASISSTIPIFDPQNQCPGGGSIGPNCVKVGSMVSLQGVLSNAGVVTATSLDVIDASSPPDEVEGIFYPSNCNGAGSYGMILGDSEIFTSGSPLTSANIGASICLTINGATTFAVDTGILTGQAGVPINVGFSSTGDILAGQVVRARVTGAVTGVNAINATATGVILRFSRLTGTVATSGITFTMNGLPSYTGINGSPQVATYTNATLFEGISDPNSLTVGQKVSINALYLNAAPNFQAAKVRVP